MHTFKTLLITTVSALSILFLDNTALAKNHTETERYSIKLIEDCQVIKEIPLNSKQTLAYLALKKEEDVMKKLEAPIHAIEKQLSKYTAQIEKLSLQAFENTEHSYQINKTALTKQKLIVEKLDKFMDLHQADFDALGAQGKRIEVIADKFSKLITPTINNIEHNQITISRQGEVFLSNYCHSENDIVIF